MSRSYVQELEEALRKIALLERVRAGGTHDAILSAAMKVINKHDLAREFCDELTASLENPKLDADHT